MLYTPLTKKALKLSFDSHKDQVDKSGAPYVFHPFHLAEQMQTEDEVCVALLHDVLEDTDTTEDDLRNAGMPEAVVKALGLLTHNADEPYFDYVSRIAQDPLATAVKLADLRHNSNLDRLDGEPSAKDIERFNKYQHAIAILTEQSAAGVSAVNAGRLPVFGAVVGDIVGSVFEWDNIKTVEFPLFVERSFITDDSVMTVAIAEALMNAARDGDAAPAIGLHALRHASVESMRKFGRRYPDAGYGGRFGAWLHDRKPKPYNSWGNGSAMRVSPVAWVAESLERAELLAAATAEVTHNHPEGIRGAQATAACAYLALQGRSNDEIRRYVEANHGYDLEFTIEGIRAGYQYDVSCMGSVPQAIVAFLESSGFEDAIRRAISIGGDSDTIAAITGGIAQARYGVPDEIAAQARRRMPDDLLQVMDGFWAANMAYAAD